MLKKFVDQWKCSPLQAIVDTRILTETDLANGLAKIFQVDRLYSLRSHRIDDQSMKLLSYKEAKENVAVLLVDDSGRYDLVIGDPSDQGYLDSLKKKSGVAFTLAVGERSEIVRAIDEKYSLAAQLPTIVGDKILR